MRQEEKLATTEQRLAEIPKAEEFIAKMRTKYEAQYRLPLTPRDVISLVKIDREKEICAGCQGNEHCKLTPSFTRGVVEVEYGRLYIVKKPCAHFERHNLSMRCARAGIPARYADKDYKFYYWDDSNAEILAVWKWYTEIYPESWLYIYGGCGVGKTALASLIGRELIERGKQVIFCENQELLNELKASFDDEQVSTSMVMGMYQTCEVLILDDIGLGLLSDWGVGILEQLINERYNSNLRTIITANYDLEELEERLSSGDKYAARRIVSRIGGQSEILDMGQGDKRWGN